MKKTGKVKDLVSELLKLNLEEVYEIEIKKPRSIRSIEQNKMLWLLIHKLAKETKHDDMDIYCAVLEKADALSDYVITASDIEDSLRKSFRGVKFIRTQEVNGKECKVYKVYLGSSKMNTKEMTELLDIVIEMCSDLGIETIL